MKSIKTIQLLPLAALSFSCFVNSFAMDGKDNPQQPLSASTFRLSATTPSSSTSLTLSVLSSHGSSSDIPVSSSVASEASAKFVIFEEEADEEETDVCESSSSSSNSPPKKSHDVKKSGRIHFSDWTVDNYQEALIFKIPSDLFVHMVRTCSSLSDAARLARVCKMFNKHVLSRYAFEHIIIRELLENDPLSLLHKFVKALTTYKVRKDQKGFDYVFIRLFLQKAIFENDPRFGKFREYIFQKLMEHGLLILLGDYADMFNLDVSFRMALQKSDSLVVRKQMRVNYLDPRVMVCSHILNLALQTGDKEMLDDWVTYEQKVVSMHNRQALSNDQWDAYRGLFATTLLCQNNSKSNTPLHWACCKRIIYAIKVLLNVCHGLILERNVLAMTNAIGDTPLHCAVKCGDGEIVGMLLEAWINAPPSNANINIFTIRNNQGKTALELARLFAQNTEHKTHRIYEDMVNALDMAEHDPNAFLLGFRSGFF